MVFLDVGMGDCAAVGVGVNQQDFVVRGRCLQGEIAGGVQSAGR
jgi:hypothetical protein